MEYVFPAVIYKDKEENDYIGTFDDIEIYFQGDSIEGAFFSAEKYLREYCSLSHKMYGKVLENPRTFLDCKEHHKDAIILLVSTQVKGLTKNKEDNVLL